MDLKFEDLKVGGLYQYKNTYGFCYIIENNNNVSVGYRFSLFDKDLYNESEDDLFSIVVYENANNLKIIEDKELYDKVFKCLISYFSYKELQYKAKLDSIVKAYNESLIK